MRDGEMEGREYNFVSKEEFVNMINNDELIEYRSYNTLVNGISDVWYYGLKKNNYYYFDDFFNIITNRVVILDLQGTKEFVKYYGKQNCKVIYVYCDDDLRKERAKKRGSFDETEWNRRLADDEIKFSEENLKDIIDFKVSNNGDFKNTMYNILSNVNEVKDIDEYIKDHDIDRIFLDIDGVILHSCEAMVKILNRIYNTNVSGEDILSWNFKEVSEDIIEPELEYLFTTDEFFENVEFIDGALDFIKRHENNIIFVTKGRWQNFIGKEKLFEKYGLGNIPMIGLPMNVDKDIINMNMYNSRRSLFIDDSTKNLIHNNSKYQIQFREYKDDKKREWQDGWCGKIMYHW
jgi:guanylate kinase